METPRKYKFKLDFYYNMLLIYLLFMGIYMVVRGTFEDGSFQVVLKDPIIYIVAIFIIIFAVILLINKIKNGEILIYEDKIEIKNRFGTKTILFDDILFIKFSKEKRKFDESKSQHKIVRLKLKRRKRFLRIRLADYNNEKALNQEFIKLSRVKNK
ncbi:MAG TPA: hypothetical protein PLG90_00075 [Ignavibacteria bacterium]|nr:hypothetical protein [Ignavibacteria bacterium]